MFHRHRLLDDLGRFPLRTEQILLSSWPFLVFYARGLARAISFPGGDEGGSLRLLFLRLAI